ncbi:hypothetical protein CPB85DRAFT_1254290 [Mucidula mucida]|nr:hypothetical protein CPB85DRAFT_1254290 [Mucidula mucida]
MAHGGVKFYVNLASRWQSQLVFELRFHPRAPLVSAAARYHLVDNRKLIDTLRLQGTRDFTATFKTQLRLSSWFLVQSIISYPTDHHKYNTIVRVYQEAIDYSLHLAQLSLRPSPTSFDAFPIRPNGIRTTTSPELCYPEGTWRSGKFGAVPSDSHSNRGPPISVWHMVPIQSQSIKVFTFNSISRAVGPFTPVRTLRMFASQK